MTVHEALGGARTRKNDEFYTLLPTIEEELGLYLDLNPDLLRGKTILLPADDPESSNFTRYFILNQHILGWDRLISTCYSPSGQGKVLDVRAGSMSDASVELLEGNGDFASAEVSRFRDEADYVLTNPPFSLFRKFWAWLFEGRVQFSVIGNLNAVAYRDVFPYLQREDAWLGGSAVRPVEFRIPSSAELHPIDGRIDEQGNKFTPLCLTRWFTNLDFADRHTPIPLEGSYTENPELYPKYDNIDAIEVSRLKHLPRDYFANMGVPITFFDRWDPEQFEVVGLGASWGGLHTKTYPEAKRIHPNGKVEPGPLNASGGYLRVATPPKNKVYYLADGEMLVGVYQRVIIRRKS